MLLVVGIFLTLLSYLGLVIYHSQNHGFGGITVDNSYHGYGDNTVESNDLRISEMRNAAAVLEDLSLPNPLFEEHSSPYPIFEERSLRVEANEEIYSEQANFVFQLSNIVEIEIEIENENVSEMINEDERGRNENGIDGVLEIEKKETNEETREEEDGVVVEVREDEVEIEVDVDGFQHENSFFSDIQSFSPPSSSSSASSLSSSLTAQQTTIENMNTDGDVNKERKSGSDVNEDNLLIIENNNIDSNAINITNDYEINNNEVSHNSQTNIQINEIFNIPFPENISDSNEINGFVSEEKIRKFLFVLLKSFEHLHSSDCF
jgi:hypothetical protein